MKLAGVIMRSMKPFGVPGRIVIEDGPDVDLRPAASMSLAMIIHELATNAAKYGALSQPEGQVHIACRLEPGSKGDCVVVAWRDSGGPTVEEPARRGQGTRFIERSVGYELQGDAHLTFEPDGIRARLGFPLSMAIMPAGENPVPIGLTS